jgi:hypothetical protein
VIVIFAFEDEKPGVELMTVFGIRRVCFDPAIEDGQFLQC